MLDDLLWEAFSSTLAKYITIGEQPVRAVVLRNSVETDLDTGSTYKSNKTILVLEPKYKGVFEIEMPVLIESEEFEIREIFNFQDEIRIELVRA